MRKSPRKLIPGLLICLFVAAMGKVQTAAEPVNILITQLLANCQEKYF